MNESRLGVIASALFEPVWIGLFSASAIGYLRMPQEDTPLYAAGAGMLGFGLSLARHFDRVAECFYSSR
ncbi:hypothetical protein EXS73_01790 [Candidatus Pacearchaeota archaeon]|nr:hypothetical protein [Candidatus Pacearchaeota archaeon]